MADTPKPLVLVDGSSYLYRAYHALPPLSTSKGKPTGAVKGVINMIRRLAKDYPDSPIAVVFDPKGKTTRHALYAEYKAHRPPMPEDLREQVQPIHDIIRALGIPLLMIEGVEADDVIGTLAKQATDTRRDVIISTGDKDMAQLVSPHVTLVNTMTDTVLDREGVIAKFGVPPERIVDYLALMGDKVDNVPGVEKCGPKTAVKWLQQYDSLDGVIANADSITGKIGENLRAALPMLPLSRQLVTIHTDIELPVHLSDLGHGNADRDALRELYAECEFRSWVEELEKGTTESLPPAATTNAIFETVFDQSALADWVHRLRNSGRFAFDTETTSLDYLQAEIVGVSFAVANGDAAYVPVGHTGETAAAQLPRDAVLAALKPLLEDPVLTKIGQHIKYDMHVLANYGIALAGILEDTMLESYVLDSTATRHDMDSLALKYLNHRTITYEDVAGKGAKQIPFSEVAVDVATRYAAEDADVTLRLHECLQPQLAQVPALLSVYRDIEMPLVPVLMRMERHGARIDAGLLAEQSRQLAVRMQELQADAWREAGQEFNLDSPKQLQEILFEKLQIPIIKKTPTGQPSTAEPVLQELALDHALPYIILEYRGLAKLKSTYTDKLPQMVNPNTGRIHTSYHQAVTATGRLSSTDPNLQNIPIRTEEGRRVRRAFVASPGHVLLAADYSQIELRIMAHLSGDIGLRRAFAEGQDIHAATAAEVFDVSIDDVTPEQRRSAKAINFGLIYGMSAFGLAKQLHIGRQQAQQYIDLYFSRYPGVHQYMEDTRRKAAEQGYVETLFGRRLYLPDIRARNVQLRQAAERTAINAPMQGTAADIMKRAMLAVDAWIQTAQPEVRMIMQVHDELVLEVPAPLVAETAAAVTDRMSMAAELAVPLLVSSGIGPNWEAAH